MLLKRRPVALSVVAALACVIPLLGMVPSATADGTTPPPSTSPPPVDPPPVDPPPSDVGKPPLNRPVHPGAVMNYPNRGKAQQYVIRNRILDTINSTWGGPRDSLGAALPGNGTIRMTTWTFFDTGIAKALVRAYRRGVSVQILATTSANKGSAAMSYLRKNIGGGLYKAGHGETRDTWTFVRTCRGSCRGAGGTNHSKYYLFTNVGSTHIPKITMSTSMNATTFAAKNQWNEATTTWSTAVYDQFLGIFKESRLDRKASGGTYREYKAGDITSMFFPHSSATPAHDPVMRMLSHVHCKGATAGGDARHRTQIRIIQYATYDRRGVWIAKRLRQLWNGGCNIKFIFSAMSSPPFNILHARSGRGPIPMKRSIIRNRTGFIDHYNHNKWMTITGHWGSATNAYVVLSGSANWGNAAFAGDEQMLQVRNVPFTRAHLKSFDITWRQRSSQAPHPGKIVRGKRVIAGRGTSETPQKLELGQGDLKYFEND